MNKEDLIKYKKRISELSEEDLKARDIYLKKLAIGELAGPPVGYPSIDKPWLKYYDELYMMQDIPQMTVYDYLVTSNKEYLNRTALSYFGRKIKFNELFENIEKTAKALVNSGVKDGDIVTISLPNIPEAVYLFYACSKIGAIANMVDPRTSAEGIKSYIEEVKSDLVIIIDVHANKVSQLLQENFVKKVVSVSPADSLPMVLKVAYKLKNKSDSSEFMSWNNFIAGAKNVSQIVNGEFYKNKPLVIEHTGGTTGNPKGVILSNENINAVAVQSVMTGIDMRREHNWLDIMPTFIAYGVGMGLHLPLTIGMETILIPQFDADKFDELLLKHKPIHMVGVPSYWGTIINSKKLAKKDLSYIIAPTVGGDSMDLTLEKNANEFLANHNCKYKITKGYGMTEVCGGIVGTVDNSNLLGSVGIPFLKSNVSIFEVDTDKELHSGEIGEICLTGPNVMLGYYDNEVETNKVIKEHSDGTFWVHSGDLGYMDENGNLFVVNRIKRVIIRYDGFKVFPSLIEKVICSNEAVQTCAVVGIPDVEHSQGKLPKAHIVLKDEYKEREREILLQIEDSCIANLPEYVLPTSYQIRDNLPLTPVGKIDFMSLQAEDEYKGVSRKLKK